MINFFIRKSKKKLSFSLEIVNLEILLFEKVSQKIAGGTEKPMFTESSLKAVGCLELLLLSNKYP